MSVTYGFFNSLNGDRKYTAEQFSSMFNNLIKDGVFAGIGDAFLVKPSSGMTVIVGAGRAWFNSTWTINDSDLYLTIEEANVLLPRIDAIVLEVNHDEGVRENSIKVLKGEPATTPVNPTLVNTQFVHQYPLAYIRVNSRATEITVANITNMVGSTATPFVMGILQTISMEDLVAQWQDVLDRFISTNTTAYNEWFSDMTTTAETQVSSWTNGYETDFISWYNDMKGQLSEDAAGNLQLEIDALNLQDRNFLERSTTFMADGSVRVVESDGTVTTTTFDSNGNISEVYDTNDGSLPKRHNIMFNDDGTITETVTEVTS